MTKEVKPSTGMSIAGLVLGICSIALFWVPIVHFILVVLGAVFGGISLSRRERFGLTGLLTSLLSYIPVVMYYIWFMGAVLEASV